MNREGPPRGGNDRVAPHAREPGRSFTWPVRVYYEDTDVAGVVYYANYLRFMERARTEWLESVGFSLAALADTHGVAFVVHRVEMDFRRPARLADRLAVSVEAQTRGACRLVVAQQVLREDVTIVDATVTLACVASRRLRPARIPHALAERLDRIASAAPCTPHPENMHA